MTSIIIQLANNLTIMIIPVNIFLSVGQASNRCANSVDFLDVITIFFM
jgi:hypothetical protein